MKCKRKKEASLVPKSRLIGASITGSIIEDPTIFDLAIGPSALYMSITGSIIEDPTIFDLADGATVQMIPNPTPTKEKRAEKEALWRGFNS